MTRSRSKDDRLPGRRSLRLAIVSLATAFTVAGASRAAVPLSFEAVELGTSEATWRALKPPQPIPVHAWRACSDDRDAKADGLELAGLPKGAVVCGYVDVYGGTRLPVPFQWDGGYRLDHLRYVFEGGRLSEIRALIANDAFDDLVAQFKAAYGPPTRTVRDTMASEVGPLPRVVETWTTSQGLAEIVDPAGPPDRLSVRIAASRANAKGAVLSAASTRSGSSDRPAFGS
ncbi:MAG TPA: hypothetical protein VGG92_13790 [Caulobacteraceae bacterium]